MGMQKCDFSNADFMEATRKINEVIQILEVSKRECWKAQLQHRSHESRLKDITKAQCAIEVAYEKLEALT